MNDVRVYTDDELIARAAENGWEQCVAITDRFPGRPDYPWTGWLHGFGSPVAPGKECDEWVGVYPGRQKVTYVDTWARLPRRTFSHEDRCGECGKWIEYGSTAGFEFERRPLPFCWHCKFWLDRITPTSRSRVGRAAVEALITEGGYYSIGTAKTPSSHNGHGGHWFTVTFNDGRIVETCDLWFGGEIPERFRDRLSINACLRSGRVAGAESDGAAS